MKPPSPSHKVDQKLSKWLKKLCKTRELPDNIDAADLRQYKLEDSIGIDRCEISLVPLVECLVKPSKAEELFDFTCKLTHAGYTVSAESFVESIISELGSIKLQDLLLYIGKFQVLEKWRKVANIHVTAFTAEIKELSANNPRPVAMEWLLQKTKPETLEKEYSWLIRGISEENASAPKLLANHLQKDPQGNRLAAVLACAGPVDLLPLGKVISDSENCLAAFIDVIPKLSSKAKADYPLAEIIESVFERMHEAVKPMAREYQSSALAKLTASLVMAKKLNESGKKALSKVRMISKEIVHSKIPHELAASTWILQTFEERHDDEAWGLTLKGSRQWALTFEDARLNGLDLSSLDMLGKNCGLSTFENTGETVIFDSKRHHDIEGGLLPGDKALVVDHGWSFGETILVRANTKCTVSA